MGSFGLLIEGKTNKQAAIFISTTDASSHTALCTSEMSKVYLNWCGAPFFEHTCDAADACFAWSTTRLVDILRAGKRETGSTALFDVSLHADWR